MVPLLPEVVSFLSRAHGHYIDGSPVPGDGSRIEVINPSTGKSLASVADATVSDIDAAVASSRAAFIGEWRSMPPAGRAQVLLQLATLLEKHREELAQIGSLESGKLIAVSRAFEVDQAAAFLRHFAGAATRVHGQTMTPSLPSFNGERYSAFTHREPLGVVVGIVPWNFAMMIAIWKLGSALATGCTSIIKPSQFTPLSMLRIAELATEAGVPRGVLNVVSGAGDAGRRLIEHPGTAKVSFTGSVPTGIAVGQTALAAKLTRSTLELGGKNSVGFLSDVPVDKIVAGVLEAGFIHQGQVCAAGERFFVPRQMLEPVLKGVSEALAKLELGDALDESASFGPLANRAHQQKLEELVAKAQSQGSRIVAGGRPVDRPGCYFAPTVTVAEKVSDLLLGEETFGPIATFMAYDSEEELLELMNGTPYGLSASLWTNDLAKAMNYVPRIEAGTVWVNMHTLLDPAVPFGGVKQSGIGREFGDEFINDYTELKSVMIRH